MTAPCPTFGFSVVFSLRDGLSDDARHGFWTSWRAFLEGHGLHGERAYGALQDVHVVVGDGAQATESDRVATETWLGRRLELASWSVSQLADVGEAV